MPWIYKSTSDDIATATAYAQRIPENKRRGMRKDGTRGTEENDVLAALAEICVARYFDVPYEPQEDRKNQVDLVIGDIGIEVRSSKYDILMLRRQPSRLKVLLDDREKFGDLIPWYAYVTGDETELKLHGFYSIENWEAWEAIPSDFPERTGWWIERDELDDPIS